MTICYNRPSHLSKETSPLMKPWPAPVMVEEFLADAAMPVRGFHYTRGLQRWCGGSQSRFFCHGAAPFSPRSLSHLHPRRRLVRNFLVSPYIPSLNLLQPPRSFFPSSFLLFLPLLRTHQFALDSLILETM